MDEDKSKFILEYASKKGDLIFSKIIKNDTIIIVDFYNVYCNLVKFDKFHIFTKETVFLCVKKIFENVHINQQVLIVSKDIFELSHDDKIELCEKYKKLTFVLVEDNHFVKSQNKERDDYVCFYIQSMFNKYINQSIIVSNDNFTNYNSLILNIKPFTMKIYKFLDIISHQIEHDTLNKNKMLFKTNNIEKINFYFKQKKYYKR